MKILPYLLIIIIPAMIGLAFSSEETQKTQNPPQPESRLVVIEGYLLRVTGDQVTVLWIHPKQRPFEIKVAPGIDMSR
jgi:hypothetical protein